MILYGGNYPNCHEWHTWLPIKPVRLTDDYDMNVRRNTGEWRWMFPVIERKLHLNKTYNSPASNPTQKNIWEYRDVGNRMEDRGTGGFFDTPIWRGGNDGIYAT